MFYFKATGTHFVQDSLARAWCEFIRYVEVGDDQFALRQVDDFGEGRMLRYDRTHWCDGYGQLIGCRFSRKQKWSKGFHGVIQIDPAQFEVVWQAAAQSTAATLQFRLVACCRIWPVDRQQLESRYEFPSPNPAGRLSAAVPKCAVVERLAT